MKIWTLFVIAIVAVLLAALAIYAYGSGIEGFNLLTVTGADQGFAGDAIGEVTEGIGRPP